MIRDKDKRFCPLSIRNYRKKSGHIAQLLIFAAKNHPSTNPSNYETTTGMQSNRRERKKQKKDIYLGYQLTDIGILKIR
jgi:hypothetical protein